MLFPGFHRQLAYLDVLQAIEPDDLLLQFVSQRVPGNACILVVYLRDRKLDGQRQMAQRFGDLHGGGTILCRKHVMDASGQQSQRLLWLHCRQLVDRFVGHPGSLSHQRFAGGNENGTVRAAGDQVLDMVLSPCIVDDEQDMLVA